MRKRLIQVSGFLISTLGWLFVLCTMAMDYWRITQIGGQGGSFIIKVAWYWSNLWQDCFTDSTAVTNCRDFPVLWSVKPIVQGVRGLLMCGLTLGFFGAIFCFVGMECTYIGGGGKNKDMLLFAGSVFHFVGGVSDLAAYCLYINKVARTTFTQSSPGILKVVLAHGGPRTRTYMASRAGGRTLYTGYYRPPRQYRSYGSGITSSSKLTRISQITPEKLSDRDAFV
uniref:Claudin n=1 Tax=Oncorhynchus tshawytscha TaxID=74940 RepID=A0AAZ3Q4P2_ONCTS